MFQKILIYVIVSLIAFVVSFGAHYYFVQWQTFTHPFELWKIYLFHAIISLLIIIVFEYISTNLKSLSDQLGFLYLGFMALKMMLFYILFKNILFSTVDLTMADKVSVLVPLFVFLSIEVYFLAKILRRGT